MQTTSAPARLRKQMQCPSCWKEINTPDVLWISEHQELNDLDLRLEEQQARFLPSRFTVDCQAVDMKGFACYRIACPHCHLQIPRSMLEFQEFPVALLGAPSSGKSFFLGAMTWTLRAILPQYLNLTFDDADASANVIVNEYEQSLFMSEGDGVVPLDQVIHKTREAGALYKTVRYADHRARYSAPFSFSMVPTVGHARYRDRSQLGRTVLLYDSAGEHFQLDKGQDSDSITRNMAGSAALLYTFDPTQDVQFKRYLRRTGVDVAEKRSRSQVPILQEAATRIRRFSGLKQSQKTTQPLIVVLTKCDAWVNKTTMPEEDPPLIDLGNGLRTLDLVAVSRVSSRMRDTLLEICPQLVTAAEGFSEHVYFVPVSAVGSHCRSQEDAPAQSPYGIAMHEIEPFWVSVPFLLSLRLNTRNLV